MTMIMELLKMDPVLDTSKQIFSYIMSGSKFDKWLRVLCYTMLTKVWIKHADKMFVLLVEQMKQSLYARVYEILFYLLLMLCFCYSSDG